jgi:hypothetical protein
MRRASLTLAACAVALGCADQEPAAIPTAVPLYLVSGRVLDDAGATIKGATAQILGGAFNGIQASTDDDGVFRLTRVSGPIHLVVWKEGYDVFERTLNIAADHSLDITLPKEYLDLVLGRTVRSFVFGRARPCDPAGWDARAPCRRFRLTPSTSGMLFIKIAWTGGPLLDVLITTSTGTILAWGYDEGLEMASAQAYLDAGLMYEVRINSYYTAQVFDLTAELRSDPGVAPGKQP